MSPLARRLVWVFALVGLAASLTSLYVHYQLLANPSYTSFCDVNQTVSCTQAYLLALWQLPGRAGGAARRHLVRVRHRAAPRWSGPGPRRSRTRSRRTCSSLSTVGLAVILYLAYAAFFVLKAVCVMCLTTYAAVIGLFIVSGIATSAAHDHIPRRFFADLRALVARPAAAVVLILFFVGAASAVAFFPKEAARAAAGRARRPTAISRASSSAIGRACRVVDGPGACRTARRSSS